LESSHNASRRGPAWIGATLAAGATPTNAEEGRAVTEDVQPHTSIASTRRPGRLRNTIWGPATGRIPIIWSRDRFRTSGAVAGRGRASLHQTLCWSWLAPKSRARNAGADSGPRGFISQSPQSGVPATPCPTTPRQPPRKLRLLRPLALYCRESRRPAAALPPPGCRPPTPAVRRHEESCFDAPRVLSAVALRARRRQPPWCSAALAGYPRRGRAPQQRGLAIVARLAAPPPATSARHPHASATRERPWQELP
jgi:hypothetical protein